MKKILIVINRIGVGGAERLLVDEINEMLRRGLDVRLLTLRPEKAENSLAAQCNIAPEHWQKIYFKSFFSLGSWIELVRFLRTYRPDATVSYLWYSNTISRIACLVSGVGNHYAFEQNVYDAVKNKKMFIIDRLLQGLSKKIIAVSGAVERSLLRHGINPKRIVVLFNAVDTSRYAVVPTEALIEEINPTGAFSYLFIGRLIEQKAVDVLLRAFAKLDRGLLLLAGSGIDRDKLVALAKELGLGERVRFLGIRHDIPALLALADCFVLPSRWEGLPLVLIEAMAAGKAIIISDFEAGAELIENDQNGLVVPKENAEALAAAMRRMQDDESLRARLKSRVKEDIGTVSIDRHVDALLGIIGL